MCGGGRWLALPGNAGTTSSLPSPAAVKCNRHVFAYEFRMDSDNLDILVFIWNMFHFRQMDHKQAWFVLTFHLRCLTSQGHKQKQLLVCVGGEGQLPGDLDIAATVFKALFLCLLTCVVLASIDCSCIYLQTPACSELQGSF